ncbi:NUDIX hydrolase [Gorillibacterium massiliense]|uniref:NUDIX hydrolase n=1 Tax=Gorillibacterium massiliense TaxID=1280390 RepID=UPI0004B7A84E|nr:NUDIX hydrolase [Gorillibacterium massiliense]
MTKDTKNPFEEITTECKPIFKGKIISLDVETVRLPNGESATREIVRHPGAVCVLAILDGKLLVVEQYRKALGKNLVEIPAGKLEPGEDPLEAAKRELEEETGYSCGSMRKLFTFYTAPGFCDEKIHLYLAEHLQAGEAHPDEDEFLEIMSLTPEEAERFIAEGRIEDAKTIMAVQAWQVSRLTGSF